jgi:hypothetical protein
MTDVRTAASTAGADHLSHVVDDWKRLERYEPKTGNRLPKLI